MQMQNTVDVIGDAADLAVDRVTGDQGAAVDHAAVMPRLKASQRRKILARLKESVVQSMVKDTAEVKVATRVVMANVASITREADMVATMEEDDTMETTMEVATAETITIMDTMVDIMMDTTAATITIITSPIMDTITITRSTMEATTSIIGEAINFESNETK